MLGFLPVVFVACFSQYLMKFSSVLQDVFTLQRWSHYQERRTRLEAIGGFTEILLCQTVGW